MQLRWRQSLSLLLVGLPWLASYASAELSTTTDQNGNLYVETFDSEGKQNWARDDRKPSLYTGNYGDCMSESQIEVSSFDAAFYKDNMTVVFHIQGTTSTVNENLMMYLGVFAYGETRFDLAFNPCHANIASLCPLQANVSIEAGGIIPVSPEDISGVPTLAYSIPDFEGQAVMRIFANSTQTEIGCFSARITNGNTFSHPAAVGSILGIFTAVAIIASFATAMYGDSVQDIRKHYAHSMSVMVVFAVFHHIFFTGALSVNWPSVLVAYWSNFAWSAGMIYDQSMQNTISRFVGSNIGNTTTLGAANSKSNNRNLAGGFDLSKIYARDAKDIFAIYRREIWSPKTLNAEASMFKREQPHFRSDFGWRGDPVRLGLPLPGNYSGFAGTLAEENIPASHAFMTGFLWLLVVLAVVIVAITVFKWALEGLVRYEKIRHDRLQLFRKHWIRFRTLAILRILLTTFFMMMFLCLFQFSYDGGPGVVAVASLVFIALFGGMFAVGGYALYCRLRGGSFVSEADRVYFERTKLFRVVPWVSVRRGSSKGDSLEKTPILSISFWRISHKDAESQAPVHEDEAYTKTHGWLASRFRRTRWWFFAVWLVYEFIRACFYGGASGQAMTQVFGLLCIEIIAFAAIVRIRPFEGQRLNALVVYVLGFSKVITVALSAAFYVRFNLPRITTTVIAIVIIIVQSILTLLLLFAILVGAASSWMSVKRNRPTEQFRPRKWAGFRERYFKHLDHAATDMPRPPPVAPVSESEPELPKEPYFSVSTVRRVAKIEDEDPEFMDQFSCLDNTPSRSQTPTGGIENNGVGNLVDQHPWQRNRQSSDASLALAAFRTRNRASSVHSQQSMASVSNLPYGARPHRMSWSSRDFCDWNEVQSQRFRYGGSSTWGASPGSASNSPLVRPADANGDFTGRRASGASEMKMRERGSPVRIDWEGRRRSGSGGWSLAAANACRTAPPQAVSLEAEATRETELQTGFSIDAHTRSMTPVRRGNSDSSSSTWHSSQTEKNLRDSAGSSGEPKVAMPMRPPLGDKRDSSGSAKSLRRVGKLAPER